MTNDLDPYENVTRVFWVKIELRDIPWRNTYDLGEIRDVMRGVRSPITSLFDIIRFIAPSMQEMGIQVGWFWQFLLWLNQFSQRKHADGTTMDKRTRG